MPEYIMLFRFTKQGIEHIKESPNRVKAAKKLFEKSGAKIKSFYVVLGQYDTVAIVEAPNDETIARLSLEIGSLGNVQAETLRAFNEDQFNTIVKEITA